MASASSNKPSSEPLWFWREFEEPHGFLSQWYECSFEVDGVTHLTAEMWMMIEKAKLFGDEVRIDLATNNSRSCVARTAKANSAKETAKLMMQTTVPAEHQRLGRTAKGFDRKKWDEHKSRIVEEGNYHKFTKSTPEMRQKLLDTGDRELVEASPQDRIWGVGYEAAHAEANRAQWGENRLGKCIMAARDRIRKERR
ncbi:hypothetical protein LTR08_001325 [Meristemomyces frigidus]|nr:hypothetical protein LTR08_001325 [Meristemomyces frigidus]